MPIVPPITNTTIRREFDRIVNKRVKRHTALKGMLFPISTHKNLLTESAQVDVKTGSLGMAPFVKVGTKAIMMTRRNGEAYTIKTPFTNMKVPLTYTQDLWARMAGDPVFTNSTPNALAEYISEAIGDDTDDMNERIDQREEWMAAMMLRGGFSYSQEGGDSFTLNTGKPAANTYQVANLWDGASPELDTDIRDAKALIQDGEAMGPAPDVAICGALAAAALRSMLRGGTITSVGTTSGIEFGRGDLRSNIQDNGMIFIGRFGDIDFFEYLGSFQPDDGGALEPLIRTEYVEYFSTGARAAAMRRMFFGLIPDMKAIMAGEAVTERHLAIKEPDEDQGVYESFLKSRPLTWFYRPDWYVSQKVV